MEHDTQNAASYRNHPLVVIAGRPNTGKSTLFNRFLHKRRVITDPTPGVTRDPVEETALIRGKPVRLMDTGGFKLTRTAGSPEAVLDDLVTEKTLDALKKADLILLLLDAEAVTPEDEEFIALLRPYWDRVVAAVNKTEGGRLESEAQEFYRFGFKDLICISAEHGDRIPELIDLVLSKLDFSGACRVEEKPAIKLAVLGKPNTGKSTLCNCLTGTDLSIVSDYAGTTRDVVEGTFSFKGKIFRVLDTAGIRRKAKVKEDVEYYSVNRAFYRVFFFLNKIFKTQNGLNVAFGIRAPSADIFYGSERGDDFFPITEHVGFNRSDPLNIAYRKSRHGLSLSSHFLRLA